MTEENLKQQIVNEINSLEGQAKKDFATANGFIETHWVPIAGGIGAVVGLLIGLGIGVHFA